MRQGGVLNSFAVPSHFFFVAFTPWRRAAQTIALYVATPFRLCHIRKDVPLGSGVSRGALVVAMIADHMAEARSQEPSSPRERELSQHGVVHAPPEEVGSNGLAIDPCSASLGTSNEPVATTGAAPPPETHNPDQVECAICLQGGEGMEITHLSCTHSFHEECLRRAEEVSRIFPRV